jgi:hypothetical protein
MMVVVPPRLEADDEADVATRDRQLDGRREKSGKDEQREKSGREESGHGGIVFPKFCARELNAGHACDGLTGIPRSRKACPPSQKLHR